MTTLRQLLLGEYRIIQAELGYTPQHKTELGWQAIKEPQPTIQQARDIIELNLMCCTSASSTHAHT